MKKFLKDYLGLLAAIGLAGGSLFAFNISTSIDNALQVIKTIRVTSDGTTTNPPFMTMDGSGKYVSIGTTASGDTLNVSGSVSAKDNEVILFAGNDATNALGYPIAGTMMGIDATASSGATAQIVTYDTRAIAGTNGQVGVNIETQGDIGVNGSEAQASINSNGGSRMDLKVEEGFDYSNYDENNGSGTVKSNNTAQVNMDPDNVHILAKTGIVRTISGNNNISTDYAYGSDIQIYPTHIQIYGSGGFANMWFDSIKGLFGFGTNTPKNTIDIGGSYTTGTLGLRFSSRQNASGQILGINNSGDVITLGNIGSFGGGGGPTGPWQYGAGSPQSAQIMGAGNSSNGSRAVVGGLNNIGDGYAAFVGGGLYNEASNSGNVAVGGAYNKSKGLLLSTIVGGTYNVINSGGNVSFIGGGSDNIINEKNSAILVGKNNIINAVSSAIVGGEYNTIHGSATQSFIAGGSGNTTSGSLSFIGGGEYNTIGTALWSSIVGGTHNIVNSIAGFIVGGANNTILKGSANAIVGGSANTVDTDGDLNIIVAGEGNYISGAAYHSLIGAGKFNTLIGSNQASIVGGSGNRIDSGADYGFIGGGFGNSISTAPFMGGSLIVGGFNNFIGLGSVAATIVGGNQNEVGGGGAMFIGGGSNNHADGDGNTVVGGSTNWAGSMSGSSVQSFIGGGSHNTTIDSSRTVIGGGEKNRIEENSNLSSIIGGFGNSITSSLSSWIGGGSGNAITASGDYTTIGGGFNNIVDNAPGSFIGGGHDNNIQSGGPASLEYPNTIAGGSHNSALGILNTIAGGYHNTTDGTLYTIGGGNENSITADGDGSTIAGGSHNAITGFGYKSIIGGGVDNSITNGSDVVIGGGSNNTVSGSNSTIPGGANNVINGSNSFAAGYQAIVTTDSTFVWNGGYGPFSSTIANTFLVNAPNGVGINTSNTNGRSLMVNGAIQASNYYSSANNPGLTTTLTNIGGGGCNMVFENGLLISTSGC